MTTLSGAEKTTADVIAGIDLRGKIALVTGASSGLGLETVRTLLGAGARVIMAARPGAKLDAALSAVKTDFPQSVVDAVPLELTDFSSVRVCAHASGLRITIWHESHRSFFVNQFAGAVAACGRSSAYRQFEFWRP